MNENLAGAGRLPYVKPFVRNLDILDTEGKTTVQPTESTGVGGGGGGGGVFRVGSS
jgi:hypothetical protein